MFLGHEIPALSHAVNIRNDIARRARLCAESPPLVFDYNQKDNCEAFANLMTGVADTETGTMGAQEDKAHCIISCFCGLINCLKCCRKKRCLTDVVQARLEDWND